MTTSQETHALLPLQGSSPLNPHLSPPINPLRARIPFGAHHLNSPNEDRNYFENLPDIPLRLTRSSYFRNATSKESESSARNKRKQREQAFENERENIGSPAQLELESSSSQPSEPYSGTRMNPSPFHNSLGQSVKRRKIKFTEVFYQKINDFLDAEGLDFVDPAESIRGIKQLNWTRFSPGKEGPTSLKHIKSATQSPKLINDQIITSTLFQRRASRSQGPGQSQIASLEQPLGFSRPGSLKIFKHFKDDVHNLLQCYSPIEESNTPALSRNGSEALEKEDTPDRLTKRSSFRHLMSPSKEIETPNELKYENGLLKYARKPFKIIKSPHPEKIKMGSFSNLRSPLRNSRDVPAIHSLRSSPSMEDSMISPKKRTKHNETPSLKEGIVIRKSQFQKLKNLQDASPLN